MGVRVHTVSAIIPLCNTSDLTVPRDQFDYGDTTPSRPKFEHPYPSQQQLSLPLPWQVRNEPVSFLTPPPTAALHVQLRYHGRYIFPVDFELTRVVAAAIGTMAASTSSVEAWNIVVEENMVCCDDV
jgi:hypothetical protein